jgi:hypothetical protein
MGQLDPLDGFVTYNLLKAYVPKKPEWPNLEAEIDDIETIFLGSELITGDPLGIGDILCHTYNVAKLIYNRYWNRIDLLSMLLECSRISLQAFSKSNILSLPADRRLAFRELGLSLGLKAVKRSYELVKRNSTLFGEEAPHLIKNLLKHSALIDEIEEFWLRSENREAASWKRYEDINAVMLATSLMPDGYLG